MAYKALYRTYRPSAFEEVAGQQHIVKTIRNALKTGKLAHAYLFTGPRGTGKTTMAKLLAKALNCEEGIGHQCNMCKNCRSINDGTHPDVLELDAASNNSVDDIRELTDKVKYGTILGRYKVYIIDEVHMLSTGAFNALLKTLEEPPEHVIFVLATTEPHKILPTILSRCQRYDFTKVSNEDIKERIRVVLEEEEIPFDEAAVDLIISLCDGGMRDALSILDQVLRYSGDKLNEKDIMEVFAIESLDEKIALLNSVIKKDAKDVLRRLSNYTSKGTDIKRLTDDLLGILKDVLIYQTSGNVNYLSYLNGDNIFYLADITNEDVVLQMIDALLEAQKDYKTVPSVTSLFQVTLLKMTTIKRKNDTSYYVELHNDEVDDNDETEIVPQKPVEEVKEEPVLVKQEQIIEPVLESTVIEEIIEPAPVIEETKPEPIIQPLFSFDTFKEVDETLYVKNSENGESCLLNDELIIEAMVSNKKEIKNELLEKWPNLKRLTAHPQFGKYATMLMDGHILIASKDIIILEYPFKKSAEKTNLIENQKGLQSVMLSVFDKQMFIYAVDRTESVRLQQVYINKKQVGKLPKLTDVNIEIEVKR